MRTDPEPRLLPDAIYQQMPPGKHGGRKLLQSLLVRIAAMLGIGIIGLFLAATPVAAQQPDRQSSCIDADAQVRARDIGVSPGIFAPGPLNAITDVEGVLVGHVTLRKGKTVRTGATAILPHGGNLFQDKVPAGVFIANAYGKAAGLSQIIELGEIETPIVLTNTLSVSKGIEAILDWTLSMAGNEKTGSVNAIVGETNDGRLNDIRARVLSADSIRQAIERATNGPVPEGAVGAGTGTVAFGWKGGIGTSSRVLPASLGGHKIGVLVQSNFGGILSVGGDAVGKRLDQYFLRDQVRGQIRDASADGSIMIVVATDAPLSDRNLSRLARRAIAGLARTGASMTNGSGDYVIAFSTATSVRRTPQRRSQESRISDMPNDDMSPLFQAVAEATEEAIYNSIFMAETTTYVNPASGVEVKVLKFPVASLLAAKNMCD